MFLLSIRVTIVVYIIILKIFFFSYTFNEKSDSSSTIPTEPEVLNKPRCLDLREFITEPTCITEMKAPDHIYSRCRQFHFLGTDRAQSQDSSHESILDPLRT